MMTSGNSSKWDPVKVEDALSGVVEHLPAGLVPQRLRPGQPRLLSRRPSAPRLTPCGWD